MWYSMMMHSLIEQIIDWLHVRCYMMNMYKFALTGIMLEIVCSYCTCSDRQTGRQCTNSKVDQFDDLEHNNKLQTTYKW